MTWRGIKQPGFVDVGRPARRRSLVALQESIASGIYEIDLDELAGRIVDAGGTVPRRPPTQPPRR